jgi:uncharacterized protein
MARGTTAVRPSPVRPATWGAAAMLAVSILTLGLGLRLVDPGRVAGVQNFILVFTSLLIEAFPFIVLGALVSAAIEVFVPAGVFERLARLPRPLQIPAAAMAGFAFPVCECGSVPVARRLASKGLSVSAAVTFMLAAPILNPVVIASTAIAYRGRDVFWAMVLGRAGLGLIAAMAMGWVVGARSSADLLRPQAGDDGSTANGSPHEPRWRAFFGHLAGDALFMGRYLVLGAAVAAGLQTFVPQSLLDGVAGTAVVSIVAMMGLAFVLSLCSESDAFVAASFVQFGVGGQLAFLVFGPMVDTKLGFLYHGTFTRGFLRTVVLVVGAVTLAGALWVEVLVG